MSDKKTMGFIRWQFKDCYRSLSFWGFVSVWASVAMLVAGCPSPWPSYVLIFGVALTLADLAIIWYRFSRAMYEYEQEKIVRDLKKKPVDQ